MMRRQTQAEKFGEGASNVEVGIPSLLYLTDSASPLQQFRSDLEAQAAGATLPGLEDRVDDPLERSDQLHSRLALSL